MQIRPATAGDIVPATDCVVAAFAEDPIVTAFFGDSPFGRSEASRRFFGLLFEARIALGLPVLVALADGRVVGLAMGKDTSAATWPVAIQARWDSFEAAHPGLTARFAAYDAVVAAAGLDFPHRYLGVLGIDPAVQGTGIGSALLRAFLDLADRDPAAAGTSLETATLANAAYYRRFGFEECAAGPVGAATLRVLYRPKPA